MRPAPIKRVVALTSYTQMREAGLIILGKGNMTVSRLIIPS